MSRQETSNTFSDGLIKDLNPINTPDTALTDCVNGTIITYDGNEYSLQNDRGNYALENCKLPDGYIPVGTTEYGGILYIVSYSPIEKRMEIGSYPSTRVVTKLPDPRPDSKSGNSITSGEYSKLSAQCKLNIFSSADPEEYKLYPGDGYKLSEKASSAVSRDEFFVVDENKALHDITDEIKVSNDKFIKVSWGVPGWIAVKTHIANIDSFGIGVRSVSFPTYIQSNSKMKIKFRFRIIATDPLITNSSSGLSVTYVITDGTTKYSGDKKSIPNNLSYSLGNGGKAYYFDTNNLEFTAKEDTTITVTAVPYFHGIKYDNCETTFTYKVSGTDDIDSVAIGKEVWKYKTLDDRVLINFSTEGLDGYKSISDLELRYSIYSLDGTKIISREPIDWIFSGTYTDLEIPFNEKFVSENIYIIKFELLPISSNISTASALYSSSQLLITTKLLNEKYGTVTNFNNLEFGDWITEYKNYISNNNIKIEENEIGQATPIDVPEDLNNFSPSFVTTGPYENWKSGQESNNFNTLLSKSSFKKVASAQEITIGRAYKYSKSFKLSTDIKLLTGPLWESAIQNCEANIWCNNDPGVLLSINTDGTINSVDSDISGSCSIKSIYKPNQLTDDGIKVWSFEKSNLDDISNWTEGSIKCDLSTVKKTGDNNVGVKITSSNYTNSTEATNSNTDLDLRAVTTLASKLKTYDTMFLESITSCSEEKTPNTWGAWLNYENIPNRPDNVNSHDNRDSKYLYFMAFPVSPSYDKIQVIQIGDKSIDKDTAKNVFKDTLSKFSKLTCYDDEISGGFIELSKIDTKTNSMSEISCNGKIILKSAKYLDWNILEESGREGLINFIQNKFKSENINYNLLKSVKDWAELSSIDLAPITKSFEINNPELQRKLEEFLARDEEIVGERNRLIEAQWHDSCNPIYTIYSPNTVVYSKKDDVTVDYNISRILDLLNKKKPTTDVKALYKVKRWHNESAKIRQFAFAYCDINSNLILNTSS